MMETDKLWDEILSSARLVKEFTGILAQHARPCFYPRRGSIRREDYSRIGNSRLGGDPDLPQGWEWPRQAGCPLIFLAQINLGELATAGFIPELPGQGWLYFFMGRVEAWQDIPHQVLFYAGAANELARRPAPQELASYQDELLQNLFPCQISFEAGLSLSSEFLLHLQDNLRPFHPEPDLMMIDDIFYQETTMIGGYAHTYAGNPLEDAALARNQAGDLLSGGLQAARRQAAHDPTLAVKIEKLAGEIPYWRPLFILASQDEANMMWMDMGHLQFLIDERDLKARRFNRTYCELTST